MLGRVVTAIVLQVFLLAPGARADEVPIVGMVTSVDTVTGTLVVESASRGKTRQVTIYVSGDSKVVRFERAPEGTKPSFTERATPLRDVKPGWVVSVKTRHEGDREVAEIVRVVQER
jgi:hypothetical protein